MRVLFIFSLSFFVFVPLICQEKSEKQSEGVNKKKVATEKQTLMEGEQVAITEKEEPIKKVVPEEEKAKEEKTAEAEGEKAAEVVDFAPQIEDVPTEEGEKLEEKIPQEVAPEQAASEEAEVVTEPVFPKKAEFEDEDAPDTVKSMAEQFVQEAEGIDTVTLEEPQGNWLYKRVWWERAQGRYEKIRVLVDGVWESRMNFFIKRSDFDRNVLDPFYTSAGIGQGELQEIIKEMIEFLEKDGISNHERELYEKLEAEKETLRQLALDVESVADFDDAMDKALHALMDQINRVRGFEKQAWENFKEIAQVLSDTKAEELYYMMDGAWQNIKNIGTYIEKDFTPHFTKLIEDARAQIIRVQNQIKALKEKGVSFKTQAELIAQREEEEKLAQQEAQAQKEKEDKKPKKKLGWIGWLESYLWSFWDMIVSIVRLPYDLIFSGKK